jgi:hypothetical protein
MKIRAAGVAILLLGLGCVAAGEASPYEKTLQTMIGSLDVIAKSLRTIIDEDTAGAAKADLRKSAGVWIEARAKAGKLPPPEKDEKVRLEKIYKPKLEEALRKLNIEVRRVENIPGGKEALKEIGGVLKKKDEEEKKAP